MQYSGTGKAGTINLRIWNSRDGVTPFIMFSKEFGIELQHVNWTLDRYDPTYLPKKGDLIWRTWTKEEAEENGRKFYQARVDEYEQVKDLTPVQLIEKGYNNWDPKLILPGIIERGVEASIKSRVIELFDTQAPKLELVKKDWTL